MKSRHALATAALIAVLLTAALLAGCGGSSSSSGNGVADKTPAEILTATKAASKDAASVHVAGSIVSGKSPITLDMELLANKGGRGKLSERGLAFELIQVSGTVYIKGSARFYQQIAGSAAAHLLQGKWLKAPSNDPSFASLSQLTDLRQLVDQTLKSHGSLKKTGTTTIKGQKVVGVTDTAKGGTLYIATTGKPYPIEISKDGAGGGTINFDRWNGTVTLAAPANAIDIAQLQSAAK